MASADFPQPRPFAPPNPPRLSPPAGVSLFIIAAPLPSVSTPGDRAETFQRPGKDSRTRSSRVPACRGVRPFPALAVRSDRRRLRPRQRYGVADTLSAEATDFNLPPQKTGLDLTRRKRSEKTLSKMNTKIARTSLSDMSARPRPPRVHALFLGFRARLWCTEAPRPETAGKNFFRLPPWRTEPPTGANIQRERRITELRGCHFRTVRVA